MGYNNILLEKTTAEKLTELFEACKAENQIIPVSGYRTRKEQEEIFVNSVKEKGLSFTTKYVALPNSSEHQTGLAIDVGLNKDDVDFLCPDFPDSGACGRFNELAADFGFILRYPEGKEKITGISYEPWHFRYVGAEHAKIIKKEKLCLEEYLESKLFLKQ